MSDRPRANSISFKGIEENYGTAKAIVKSAGDLVLVQRGVIRAAVIRCPSGCGDDIVINLDSRTGPAWRLYKNRKGITLYPSVWRDTGCGSHFIVWHNKIFWCDYEYLEDEEEIGLDDRVAQTLTRTLTHYCDLAEDLGETPWSVMLSCRRLKKRGLAMEGAGKMKGAFALADAT
jgi:hypothetical protein